jgi:hypothetical protein
VPSASTISEISWFGVYDPNKNGSGGQVTDFLVAIYSSIAGGTQPDISSAPLIEVHTGGNAGETSVGQFGGTTRYLYDFILPTAFHAGAQKKYWLQIEALQSGVPDWCIAKGTGGNGSHFRSMANGVDFFYQAVSGDGAFILLDQSLPLVGGRGKDIPSSTAFPFVHITQSGASLQITFHQSLVGGKISISDVLGRIVMNAQPIFSRNLIIDDHGLPAGSYFMLVSGKDDRFAEKFIMNR